MNKTISLGRKPEGSFCSYYPALRELISRVARVKIACGELRFAFGEVKEEICESKFQIKIFSVPTENYLIFAIGEPSLAAGDLISAEGGP